MSNALGPLYTLSVHKVYPSLKAFDTIHSTIEGRVANTAATALPPLLPGSRQDALRGGGGAGAAHGGGEVRLREHRARVRAWAPATPV